MDPRHMTPEQLIKHFATQLNAGHSMLIPKAIVKDAMIGLINWQGFKKEDLVVHETKNVNHITLTLLKNVKT